MRGIWFSTYVFILFVVVVFVAFPRINENHDQFSVRLTDTYLCTHAHRTSTYPCSCSRIQWHPRVINVNCECVRNSHIRPVRYSFILSIAHSMLLQFRAKLFQCCAVFFSSLMYVLFKFGASRFDQKDERRFATNKFP